ncbi:hypothetical protein GCM10009599_22260 [Luteococcus peritonei]
MYHSNGNYEAFARPRKPAGVEQKQAWIVGAGLASLAAAVFLVRDAQMDPRRITILEAMSLPEGACDGIEDPAKGFKIRGGREMENHFECLWDLFRSIPSLETEGASVLDEFYWLNKDDPNYSLTRATMDRGQDGRTDGTFTLSDKAQRSLMKLFLTRNQDLEGQRIVDVLIPDFFESNFWLYWRTMFAFEDWHSALEMKLCLQRFVHHIGGLPDFSALKFTRYNQYESLILPMVSWLQQHGVNFVYDTRVPNVVFDITARRKVARRIEWLQQGRPGGVDLDENQLVFVTNGSCVENTSWGDHHTAPVLDAEIRERGVWSLWRNIARQDPSFGRPDAFCTTPPAALPQPVARAVRGLDLRPVHRPARGLRAQADAGVHRRGDRAGVAVPPGRSRRPDRRSPGPVDHLAALHDALHHQLLPAPSCRGPSRRRAPGLRELRLPGAVRRDRARHHPHHRVLGAYRHGGGLHPARRGARRTGGLGQHL